MQIECERVNYAQFADLDPSKPLPQQVFMRLLHGDQIEEGDILDIGAGPGPNRFLHEVFASRLPIDGVDIDEAVLNNKQLRKIWHCPFETADIDSEAYRFAIAYCVVEHIERARPFFSKLAEILTPGGVFWAYAPYANHPFAALSRSIEVVGLKHAFSSRSEYVNDYPAYYRLNNVRSVKRALEGLPFASAKFYLLYAPGWKNYFPRSLQFFPKFYDAVTMHRSCGVIAYRLEKCAA